MTTTYPPKAKQSPVSLPVRATLLVTSTLTVMAGAIISPTLPAIQEIYGDEDPDGLLVRLVLTLPALFIVIGAPIAGFIIDRYGRKPLLIFSAILYGIAGGSGIIAPDLITLLIGRAFLGLAVAGIMTTVTTLIADYFSGPARSSFLGIQSAFMGLGGTFFLSIAGVMADMGWRWPFLVYLFSFLLVPFIVNVLYEPDRKAKPEDAADETFALDRVPLRLMAFVYTLVVCVQIAFYTIPVQLPFYLTENFNATGSQSGITIAMMSLFFAIGASLFGQVDKRLDHFSVIVLGFLITGTGFFLINAATDWPLLLLGLPMGGFGLGLVMPNLTAWLANETPAKLRGRILGGITLSLFLGQFLSPIVLQPFIGQIGIGGVYAMMGGIFLTMSGFFFIVSRVVHLKH